MKQQSATSSTATPPIPLSSFSTRLTSITCFSLIFCFARHSSQSTGANAKRPDRGASDTGSSSVSAGMGEMKVDGGPGRGQKKGAAVQLEMSEGPKPADKQNEKVKPVIFMQDDDEAFDDLDSDDPDDDLDL